MGLKPRLKVRLPTFGLTLNLTIHIVHLPPRHALLGGRSSKCSCSRRRSSSRGWGFLVFTLCFCGLLLFFFTASCSSCSSLAFLANAVRDVLANMTSTGCCDEKGNTNIAAICSTRPAVICGSVAISNTKLRTSLHTTFKKKLLVLLFLMDVLNFNMANKGIIKRPELINERAWEVV